MNYTIKFDDSLCDIFCMNKVIVRVTLDNGLYHQEVLDKVFVDYNHEELKAWAEEKAHEIATRDYSLEHALESFEYFQEQNRLWKVIYNGNIFVIPDYLLQDKLAFQWWMDRRLRYNV